MLAKARLDFAGITLDHLSHCNHRSAMQCRIMVSAKHARYGKAADSRKHADGKDSNRHRLESTARSYAIINCADGGAKSIVESKKHLIGDHTYLIAIKL